MGGQLTFGVLVDVRLGASVCGRLGMRDRVVEDGCKGGLASNQADFLTSSTHTPAIGTYKRVTCL